MPRDTMTSLIARVRGMCNGDTALTADDYQLLLDDHAFAVECALTQRPPFFTQHQSPFENLEDGAQVYVGYNTLLTEDDDYTIDLPRGIVTTPAADYRVLYLQGMAYDLNAAAADGWERIAARYVGQFDFSSVEGRYSLSQQLDQARTMAAHYRARAWAVSSTVDRADTPAFQPQRADQVLEGFQRALR